MRAARQSTALEPAQMAKYDWSIEPWLNGEGELHTIRGKSSGQTLLILGGVHGNEPAGSYAIHKIIAELRAGTLVIEAGTLMLVPDCNLLAKKMGQRFVDRDLNRDLRYRSACSDYEDLVGNRLLETLPRADILLDIHTHGHGDGQFLFLGPDRNSGAVEPFDKAHLEYQFAASLNVDVCIYGWLSAYAKFVERQRHLIDSSRISVAHPASLGVGVGTLETFRSLGGYGVTIECGPHLSEASGEVAFEAIKRAIGYAGLSGAPKDPPKTFKEIYEFQTVLIKEHSDDVLSQHWRLLDKIPRGHVVGTRQGKDICFDEDIYTIFCYPDAPVGQAWLYIAQRSDRRA